MSIQPAYIAGKFRTTAASHEVRSPFDGSLVTTVSDGDSTDMEEAIAAAQKSLEQTRKLSAYDRAQICLSVAKQLIERKEELAMSLCMEGGKPIGDSRAEVDRAVHCFETAAAEAERLGGEVMPLDLRPGSFNRFGLSKRVPVGVIGAISPFNFPLNLGVHKVAPAIAAGCPVVLKPASQTPTACLKLAEMIDKTAWPKGALSVIPCSPQVADPLVTDDRIGLLTFTGSPGVGWDMKKRSGKKKIALELGSNSGCIVDESADLDYAIPRIVYGAFSYAGQKCISVQRLFVHEKIYGVFTEKFIAATQAAKVGDPRDPEVLVGPMINESGARRVEAWIEEAKQAGAKVLSGGPRSGNIIPPTILSDVPRTCEVSCEEVFGPIVTLEPYKTFDDAIRGVNDSQFGLQAGVFSTNTEHMWKSFDEIECGGVVMNDVPSYRIDPMPYGGVKNSGLGREGIRFTIEEMTELRFMVVNKDHHLPKT